MARPTAVYFAALPRSVVLMACTAGVAVLGWLRYLSGPEYSLSAFYLLPIMAATWFAGRQAGILLGFLSAFSWLTADVWLLHRYSDPMVPMINATLRLLVFLLVVVILSKLRATMERVRCLAMTDALTGIANRRAFFSTGALLVNSRRKSDRRVALVFFDADNFKSVNDTYGHRAGDDLLRCAAQTLRRHLRTGDFVARVGGDEFLVLLTDMDPVEAETVAGKLSRRLDEAMTRNGWEVSFSYGVAAANESRDTVEGLVKRADRRMYAAKQSKRHRG